MRANLVILRGDPASDKGFGVELVTSLSGDFSSDSIVHGAEPANGRYNLLLEYKYPSSNLDLGLFLESCVYTLNSIVYTAIHVTASIAIARHQNRL